MATKCEMIIGFLVPRGCEHTALGQCMQCGRSYCEEHISVSPNGLLCEACRQGLDRPVAIPLTAQSFNQDDMAIFDRASQWDSDDDMFSDLS